MPYIDVEGRRVEVVSQECRWLRCLRPGYHTIRSAAGASGCSARTETTLSCVRWTDYGCPPNAKERFKATLEDVHEGRPRFAWCLQKPGRGNVRCLCCHQLFPRWLVYEWQQRVVTLKPRE